MTIVCSTITVDLSNVSGINRIIRWTDAPFNVLDEAGNEYTAYGSLIKIDSVTTENTINNKALNISLNGLDPSISAVINSVSFREKPITIKRCFIESGTNRIVESSVYWRGLTAVPELSVDYTNNTVSLSVSCKSLFDLSARPHLARCNTATHQIWHTGDKFYEFANAQDLEDELWTKA